MTIVVGVRAANGAVVLAADRAASFGGTLYPTESKIVVLDVYGTEVALGIAGDGALAAVAKRDLRLADGLPSPRTGANPDSWAREVAARLSRAAVNAQPAPLNEQGRVDGVVLLATGSWLWMIAQQSVYPVAAFGAIGAGRELALGALAAMDAESEPIDGQAAAARAASAVDIACRFEEGCSLMGQSAIVWSSSS